MCNVPDLLGSLSLFLGNLLGLFAHLLKLIGTLIFQSLLMSRTTGDVSSRFLHLISHIQLLVGSIPSPRILLGLRVLFSLG